MVGAVPASVPVGVAGQSPPPAGSVGAVASDLGPPKARLHPIAGWLASGVGPGLIGGQGGDVARVELALAAGIHLFSLRYAFAADSNGSCGDLICTGNDVSLPHNSVKELAVQYGIKERVPYFVGTASAGLSSAWTVQRGSSLLSMACFFGCAYQYSSINRHTIGATAELGGYLTSRYLSMGPSLIADVNSIQSFWSLLIDVHVGWMGETR
jgi:hypothetical protein